MILALIDDRDLIYGDIRDLFLLVTQIQHTGFYVDHIASKRGVGPARDVDLFTHQLLKQIFHCLSPNYIKIDPASEPPGPTKPIG